MDEQIIEGMSANVYGCYDLTMDYMMFGKNIFRNYTPASNTKLITVLYILLNSSVADTVYVDDKTWVDGLYKGEKYSIYDCLHGILLASSNTMTRFIGKSLCGDLNKYVCEINKLAKSIGMNNSYFFDCDGCSRENKTNVVDIVKVYKELVQNKFFMEIINKEYYYMNSGKRTWVYQTTNKLVRNESRNEYATPFALGGKTGTIYWHENNGKLVKYLYAFSNIFCIRDRLFLTVLGEIATCIAPPPPPHTHTHTHTQCIGNAGLAHQSASETGADLRFRDALKMFDMARKNI